MTDPINPEDATTDATTNETAPDASIAEPTATAEPIDETGPAARPMAAADPAPAPAPERTVRRARGSAPRVTTPRPLSPYAVIETGGKQYRVSVGESLAVERLAVEAGSDLTIDRVLMLGGDGTTRVGTPTVAGASVTARVDDHYRGEKIIVFKYKAKKRYRRRNGHRQSLTRLTITGINA